MPRQITTEKPLLRSGQQIRGIVFPYAVERNPGEKVQAKTLTAKH